MNNNVTTFLANLKHDIRNRKSVEVGGGIFKGQELVDVANTLTVAPELLEALEALHEATLAMNVTNSNLSSVFEAEAALAQARAAIAKATQ